MLFRLKEQESRLNDITEKQGTNVDSFVKLVKENKELVKKQKVRSCSPNYRDAEFAIIVFPSLKVFLSYESRQLIVRQETAQLLSSVIINSDGDYSGTLDEKEAKKLAIKLNALPGVNVEQEALSSALKDNDGSLGYLLKVCNEFTDQEYGSTEIFSLETNETLENDEKKSQE